MAIDDKLQTCACAIGPAQALPCGNRKLSTLELMDFRDFSVETWSIFLLMVGLDPGSLDT